MSAHAHAPPAAPALAPPPAPRRAKAPGAAATRRVALAWGGGILLCAIAAAIVLYMLFRGLQYLSLGAALRSHPLPSLDQSQTRRLPRPDRSAP